MNRAMKQALAFVALWLPLWGCRSNNNNGPTCDGPPCVSCQEGHLWCCGEQPNRYLPGDPGGFFPDDVRCPGCRLNTQQSAIRCDWEVVASGTTQDLHSVTRSRTGDTYCSYSPCDPGEFWAVGAGGIALRWAGEQWQPVDTGTTRDLWAVLSNEFGDVYAVGDVGTIIRWNGGEFEQVQSDTGANLRAGHLLSNRHLYVLADTGEVRFFDGQWHSIHQTGPLRAMGQHDDAGASAVGDDGRWVACRRDACTERFLDGGPLLRGVAGDEFRTWAVGDSTIVSLEDLLTWEPRAGQFNAVCATSRGVSNSGNSFRQSDVWTVGNNGAVAHFTATGGASSSGSGEFFTAWAPESGGASSLVGVACSAQDVWAVGAGGLLMRLHIPFALAE